MTKPTDADRAKAAEIVTPNFQPKWHGDFLRKAIAAALAAERVAAVADLRARVEAVAEEHERVGNDYFAAGHREKAYDALEHAARLRAAVTDTTGDPA